MKNLSEIKERAEHLRLSHVEHLIERAILDGETSVCVDSYHITPFVREQLVEAGYKLSKSPMGGGTVIDLD